MPKTQTLGDIIKLGDLPIEDKEQIADAILYSAEHVGELYNEVNHVPLDENRTSITFVRSYLPEIDKTSERYKNGLIEGVTPDAESINEAEFSVGVREIGWYYKLTTKSAKHAWSDLKARCTKFLTNLFKTYHDEKIADAYLSSANIVTSVDLLALKDLVRLHTILFENGAIDENGFYKLRVNSVVADAMLVVYKDIITHTTQKEAVVTGELGEIAGFRVIRSRLQAFRKNASNNYPFVAYGKNSRGEFPVSIVSYDDMKDQIMYTPPGGLGNDPLKQRLAIGLYIDGHGFFVVDDSVAVVGAEAASSMSSYVSSASGTNLDANLKLENSARSELKRDGAARAIVPAYDYIKMYRYSGSSGTTANTFTLTAKKADGTAWVFDDDGAGKLKVVSGNTSVVTVADGVITTAGTGIATLVISQYDKPELKTIITVEVISGNSNGVNPVLD